MFLDLKEAACPSGAAGREMSGTSEPPTGRTTPFTMAEFHRPARGAPEAAAARGGRGGRAGGGDLHVVRFKDVTTGRREQPEPMDPSWPSVAKVLREAGVEA